MYKKLNIENSYSVKQNLFKDERGFFTEYLHFPSELPLQDFVTQNISYSKKGTIRVWGFRGW
jgi:dTDP-4-dehydrorhamnose 3,5-epimerase-like enzyme